MTCIQKGHGPGKSVKSNIGLAERITSMYYVTYYTAGRIIRVLIRVLRITYYVLDNYGTNHGQ